MLPSKWGESLVLLLNTYLASGAKIDESSALVVGVIDTAAKLNHTWLQPYTEPGRDFLDEPGKAYKVNDGVENKMLLSGYHGQHVAGIVAGLSHNEGYRVQPTPIHPSALSGGFGWLDRIYSFLSDELRLFSWLLMPLV